jgi:hypothetical protein
MALPAKTPSPSEVLKYFHAVCDQMRQIEIKREYGHVVARIGWTIDLVFHEGNTLPVREKAWNLVDLFCTTFGVEKLNYWWDLTPEPMISKLGRERMAHDKALTLNDPDGHVMMFNIASGRVHPPDPWVDNVQDIRLYCRLLNTKHMWSEEGAIRGHTNPRMSIIRLGIYPSWIKSQPIDRNVGWLTDQCVRIMEPFWCTAGWGVMPAIEEAQLGPSNEAGLALEAYLQRFPGINSISSPALFGSEFSDAMHSVTWLTYVSDPLLEKIGGRAKVISDIEKSTYLTHADLGKCLGIRVGGFPLTGDKLINEAMPSFGEAARLLKPIRIKSYANRFVAPRPDGPINEDTWRLACDAYLSRFDDY